VVWQQRLNLPDDVLLHSVVMQQKSAEGQSDKMVPDMQVHMKQRYITEFLHMEKKMHILTFISACQMFMEAKEWM